MREHITPERVANAIRQDKSYQGSYLIVEGKSDYLIKKLVKLKLLMVA